MTTFSTASRARLRRAKPSGPSRVQTRKARAHRGVARGGVRDHATARRGRGQLADSGGGGLPRPDGREPSGRGAAIRSARPYPQAASPRRNAQPMAATAQTGRAVLLAPGILSPRKDHSKGRSLRSRRLLRNRRPLTVIFHGKIRQLSRGRGGDEASPTPGTVPDGRSNSLAAQSSKSITSYRCYFALRFQNPTADTLKVICRFTPLSKFLCVI